MYKYPGAGWKMSAPDDNRPYRVNTGDTDLVKIPEIPGRIYKREKGRYLIIEYIYEHTYDKEKKQSRNKRAVIGKALRSLYPGMMVPNENYERFFDPKTGELLENKSDDNDPIEAEYTIVGDTEDEDTDAADEQDSTGYDDEEEFGSDGDNDDDDDDDTDDDDDVEDAEDPDDDVDDNEDADDDADENGKDNDEYDDDADEEEADDNKESDDEENNDSVEPKAEENEKRTKGTAESATEKEPAGSESEAPKTQKTEKKYTLTESELEDLRRQAIRVARKEIIDRFRATQETDSRYWTDEQLRQYKEDKAQMRRTYYILFPFFEEAYDAITIQAKKRMDGIISAYKARKLNELFEQMQDFLDGTDYLEFLDLIEEPYFDVVDGVEILKGMTYSDVQILMGYYNQAMYRFYEDMGYFY